MIFDVIISLFKYKLVQYVIPTQFLIMFSSFKTVCHKVTKNKKLSASNFEVLTSHKILIGILAWFISLYNSKSLYSAVSLAYDAVWLTLTLFRFVWSAVNITFVTHYFIHCYWHTRMLQSLSLVSFIFIFCIFKFDAK
jgi:hypothetical protein